MIGRRGAIGGLVTSWWAAGNARTPQGPQVRESQRPDRRPLGQTRAGVGPAPQQGTFIGRLVIVSGPGSSVSGVFLYKPSPGAANLSGSFSESSVDPYGDKLIPGSVAFYNPGINEAIGLQATGLGGFTGSFSAGWTQAAFINFGGNSIEFAGSQQAGAFYTLIGPSGDTTGAQDSLVFSSLSASETLLLVPGTYYINAPIAVPDGCGLVCLMPSWGIPTGNYGNGSLPLQGAIIRAGSAFSGARMIGFNPTGDASTQHGGQFLTGITVDGTGLPAANTVVGIESVGFVAGVKLTDVVVSGHYNSGTTTGLGSHGLYCHNDGTGGHNPDFWQITRCKFSGCGGYGMETIAMSDSWYVDGECTGNNLGGANIQNGGESRMLGWRCNNNATVPGTPGLAWSGLTGFTGKFVVDGGCDFSANGVGIAVTGSGTGTITMHSPVADGNTTQWTYAGTNHVTSDAAYNVSTAAPTFA